MSLDEDALMSSKQAEGDKIMVLSLLRQTEQLSIKDKKKNSSRRVGNGGK